MLEEKLTICLENKDVEELRKQAREKGLKVSSFARMLILENLTSKEAANHDNSN